MKIINVKIYDATKENVAKLEASGALVIQVLRNGRGRLTGTVTAYEHPEKALSEKTLKVLVEMVPLEK